ncbi:MAG TPA: twin-arginine translocase TatA/TatE family subunit [Acidimicrobiia bacterium]|nr:twin-arginine translocase TatA/TatE family subunit [Acidimicrobiia bacterium]
MLQGGEIIIILLVALIVLGPQRLPEAARKLGQWSVELRRAARDLRAGLEAEVGDLREIRRDLEAPVDEARREYKQVTQEMDAAAGDVRRLKWVGPEPKSGPTAEDAMKDLDEIEGEAGKDAQA